MICEAALKLKEAKQPVICEAALKLKEALQRDRPTFAVAFSTLSLQLRYLQGVKHTSAIHHGAENSAGSSSPRWHSCLHVHFHSGISSRVVSQRAMPEQDVTHLPTSSSRL